MFTENSEKGASAVEFAIVVTLLFLILLGLTEFGFIMYDKAVITNASREGARKGIVFREPCAPGDVTAEVIKAAKNYGVSHLVSLGDKDALPEVTPAGNCCITGSDLTVTVTYPYKFLFLPNFAGGLPPKIMLTGVTVMNCENQ